MTAPATPHEDDLMDALQTAVPLRILEIRDWTEQQRLNDAAWYAQLLLTQGGDVLMYGTTQPGRVAATFRNYVHALAILAYAPGGVTVSGVHWCADHTACQAASEAPA